MNVRMVDAAVQTIKEVDVLGLVVDAAEPPGKGERFVVDLVKDAPVPVFLLLNKVDLIRKPRLLPMIEFMTRFRRNGSISLLRPAASSRRRAAPHWRGRRWPVADVPQWGLHVGAHHAICGADGHGPQIWLDGHGQPGR